MSFDNDIDIMDSIEACRTCGVFFLTNSSFLRQMFTPAVEDPEMMHIRMELSSWKVEINENDGYPQYICTGCILEFQKIFKFRRSCVDIQKQLQHFYHMRQQNQVQIKNELPDEEEENICDFIYVDDLSDTEYDGATPFNISHVPIKEEHIEEATIPSEIPATVIDTANTNVEGSGIQHGTALQENKSAAFPENTETNAAVEETFETAAEMEKNPDSQLADTGETAGDCPSLQFQCDICKCLFANIQQHKLHMKRLHYIKDFECHICGKTFKNSSATRLKFHLKWHKISKHIKCAQCGFYCNSREILREHTRQTHSKVNCTLCGKNVLPKRMKEHLKTHDCTESNIICSFCTQAFSSAAGLSEHISIMHVNEEQREISKSEVQNACTVAEILCALCNQTFANKEELELHMQQHRDAENSLNKPADEDKTLYMQSSDVSSENRHLMESLTLGSEEPVKMYCFKCHQEFFDDNELAQHLQDCQQQSIDEDSSQTAICNKFNGMDNDYLENYKNEELQHIQKDNNYMDGQDNSNTFLPNAHVADNEANDHSFDNVNQLNQLHSFGCAQCTDTFECVEELLEHHERMHPKKSNFKCPICDKVYELKFSLNRHMRKHNV